ncbi:putative phosphomevalonate kinase [Amylocarpus encephaloides]|uniref:Phosphomevalonate kinase n=1 Tax=Amylocarpus encephaloides TaxID=45428 RepID=A0A9P8C713_9HELO|nr:putative phosphomevalonate kinase [Amylocarpus encephaloides]
MPTAVSAPGKVLLAGGYLVLDRTYTGLVFGLSARIHVLVHDISSSSSVEISVQSPQFHQAAWIYGYHLISDQGGVDVTQLQGYEHFSLLSRLVASPLFFFGTSSSINKHSPSTSHSAVPAARNPFVETALLYALTYISTVLSASQKIKPTKITILADDSYYSNPATSTVTPSSHFSNFDVSLRDAHKTGLGSSAALVTSFTGAVLAHYLPTSSFDLTTTEGQTILHNISQAAHCSAQGKVGSGFDVAAAVYGTCIYRRFSPSILSYIGEAGSKDFSKRVKTIVENTASSGSEKWDTEISANSVTLPKGLAMVMCDVDCGSQTVGMVKKVLEWRKSDAEGSKKLWDELQSSNTALATAISAGSIPGIKSAFSSIREKIREMGKLSDVPIEPQEQTELIDALTEAVPGVVGGVVPGAGGYDAVSLLVKDDEETMTKTKAFLKKWSAYHNKGTVRLLEAKGELEGARLEKVEEYGDGFA